MKKDTAKKSEQKPKAEPKGHTPKQRKDIVEVICGVMMESTHGIRRICDAMSRRVMQGFDFKNPDYGAVFKRRLQLLGKDQELRARVVRR